MVTVFVISVVIGQMWRYHGCTHCTVSRCKFSWIDNNL